MSIAPIRWLLTAALLLVVGFHVHWSVSFCLTPLALTEEITAASFGRSIHKLWAKRW